MSRRSVTARIDKNLKELIEDVSQKEGISQTEASRELWKEITGHSLFERTEEKEERGSRRRNIFG